MKIRRQSRKNDRRGRTEMMASLSPKYWFLVCLTIAFLSIFRSSEESSSLSFSFYDESPTVVVARDEQRQLMSPQQCTRDELLTIRSQINPEGCPSARKIPYMQKCGITLNTKCVDATNWLDEYYAEIYYNYDGNGNDQEQKQKQQPFLGISVGCNKGFDALNTLRMGIFDASLDKQAWQTAMVEANGGEPLHISVCAQNDPTDQFRLPPPVPPRDNSNNNNNNTHNAAQRSPGRMGGGEMHCFEPMPQTAHNLKTSTERLGYDRLGFKVIQNLVSNQPGTVSFFTGAKAGVENIGIENECSKPQSSVRGTDVCKDVDVVTLKDYVEHSIDNKNNNKEPIIHHLSIDVEGYDVDVLFGAGPSVLKRVEYLEFEYNWMGSWKRQHLHDVISMLDGKKHRPIYNYKNETLNNNNHDTYSDLSFTCYWAGKQRLWRITDCWMRFYDIHTWGNVACANRKLAPRLAAKMEAVFKDTITSHSNNNADDRTSMRGSGGSPSPDPMLQTDPHDSMVSIEYDTM